MILTPGCWASGRPGGPFKKADSQATSLGHSSTLSLEWGQGLCIYVRKDGAGAQVVSGLREGWQGLHSVTSAGQGPAGSAWPPAAGLCPVLCVVGFSASDLSEMCLPGTRSFQSACSGGEDPAQGWGLVLVPCHACMSEGTGRVLRRGGVLSLSDTPVVSLGTSGVA